MFWKVLRHDVYYRLDFNLFFLFWWELRLGHYESHLQVWLMPMMVLVPRKLAVDLLANENHHHDWKWSLLLVTVVSVVVVVVAAVFVAIPCEVRIVVDAAVVDDDVFVLVPRLLSCAAAAGGGGGRLPHPFVFRRLQYLLLLLLLLVWLLLLQLLLALLKGSVVIFSTFDERFPFVLPRVSSLHPIVVFVLPLLDVHIHVEPIHDEIPFLDPMHGPNL